MLCSKFVSFSNWVAIFASVLALCVNRFSGSYGRNASFYALICFSVVIWFPSVFAASVLFYIVVLLFFLIWDHSSPDQNDHHLSCLGLLLRFCPWLAWKFNCFQCTTVCAVYKLFNASLSCLQHVANQRLYVILYRSLRATFRILVSCFRLTLGFLFVCSDLFVYVIVNQQSTSYMKHANLSFSHYSRLILDSRSCIGLL